MKLGIEIIPFSSLVFKLEEILIFHFSKLGVFLQGARLALLSLLIVQDQHEHINSSQSVYVKHRAENSNFMLQGPVYLYAIYKTTEQQL